MGSDILQERIYQSAPNSYSPYMLMTSAATRMEAICRSSFDSNTQILDFVEQISNLMKLSKSSTEEMNLMMMQLARSMEMNTMSAGNLVFFLSKGSAEASAIAYHMGVSIKEFMILDSRGAMIFDVISNAVSKAADIINKEIHNISKTSDGVWDDFKNNAANAFEPVMEKIEEIMNSEWFENLFDQIKDAVTVIGSITSIAFGLIVDIGSSFSENWSMIAPIVYGAVAALVAFYMILLIIKAVELVTVAASILSWAWPILLAVALVFLLVSALVILCDQFLNTENTATTIFGKILGAIWVVNTFFNNLALSILNIFLGIREVVNTVVENIFISLKNNITDLKAHFLTLGAVAIHTASMIAEQLNKLNLTDIDISGLQNIAFNLLDKAKSEKDSKEEFKDLGKAWENGAGTFNTWKDNWLQNAYNTGAAFGDYLWNYLLGNDEKKEKENEDKGFVNLWDGLPDFIEGIADNASGINDNTSNIAGYMEISKEELKYLRDIAEREAVNRFTTAEIKVDAPIKAKIGSNMDIDGIVNHLTISVDSAMRRAAEGCIIKWHISFT